MPTFGMGLRLKGAATVNALKARLRARAKAIPPAQTAAMERATLLVHARLLTQMSGAPTYNDLFGRSGAAGRRLGTVTGNAKRTLVRRVFVRGKTVVGVVGSPEQYVALHEFGGTISGKPLLRIPTKYSKKASGQDVLAGRGARTLSNTRIFRSRKGNLFIWEVDTPRARASPKGIIPLYLLKPSVTYRARGFMKRTLELSSGEVARELGVGVARAVRKGGR